MYPGPENCMDNLLDCLWKCCPGLPCLSGAGGSGGRPSRGCTFCVTLVLSSRHTTAADQRFVCSDTFKTILSPTYFASSEF